MKNTFQQISSKRKIFAEIQTTCLVSDERGMDPAVISITNPQKEIDPDFNFFFVTNCIFLTSIPPLPTAKPSI